LGMPGSRDYSPVHVTVDANTPVHVHRLQKQRRPSAQAVTERLSRPRHLTSADGKSSAAPAAATASASSIMRRKSKSPPKSPGPWIPPPAKSSKGSKYEPAERDIDDLDDYEGRVESLISEVGKLKSEAELSRARRELSASQEQLGHAESENAQLRQSVDLLSQEVEGGDLARQLISAELELQALNRHLLAFGDLLRRPARRQSERDALTAAQEALSQRAADLGASLQRLRCQLRARGNAEAEAAELAEERAELLRRLADADAGRAAAEESAGQLKAQIAGMREQDATANGLQVALESAKGHLQFQLSQRDSEIARLTGRLRSLESELARARVERDQADELLRQTTEEAAAAASGAAAEGEAAGAVAAAEREASAARQRAGRAEAEATRLRQEAAGLLDRCERLGEENERLRARAELVSGEERQRLQSSVKSLEKQLETQQTEMDGLRSTLRHYENLIEDYKQQTEQLAGRSGSAHERAELQVQESRILRERCEDLEKRLRLAEDERREAQRSLARQQESGGGLASQLEAKQRECSALIHQLEQATSDSRRLQEREAAAAAEKRLQARVLELESGLAAQRAESARALRDKEEETRRTLQRLEDLKERLEQSQSTNKSLQSYVNFLKTSYANVLTSAGTPLPTLG
ncbi:hypothetical protein BOX15_Mlig034307g3, partial [Macrostomum lignano]